MENIKERLMRFVKSEYNEGQTAFEDRCGLSRGLINKMNNGVNSVTLARIAEVCPQLNLRWLLLGVGDMKEYGNTSVSSCPGVNVQNVQAVFITNWQDIAGAVAKAMGGK